MTSASTVSSNIHDTARDTAKDARQGVREIGKATAAASGDIENDLRTLRDDFGRLAEQVSGILSDKGTAAWQRAKSSVDGAMSGAQDKGRGAVNAVRDVSNNFVEAIDDSIKNWPYATLAIVAGLGFLFGTAWRR
jgi:ElaB/YqjD/DUF883 family membrane-anchored ribosome-binding protein